MEKVEALAEKKGCTSGQLAIAWLLHKSPNVIPLFGTKSIKNIEANVVGASVKLTPEEFAAIDSSISPSEVSRETQSSACHSLTSLPVLELNRSHACSVFAFNLCTHICQSSICFWYHRSGIHLLEDMVAMPLLSNFGSQSSNWLQEGSESFQPAYASCK